MVKRFGLVAGVTVFLALLALPGPAGMSEPARITAATTLLMAVWWLTEALPVAATALVPMAVLPAAGVMKAAAISAPYASETNMLFLGGLMIATAVERWNLHRRIALNVVNFFGNDLSKLVLGFMVGTALISAWISNSATTMMMLPVALAVADHVRADDERAGARLAPILMLAVAYSATIGGLATIVGTPPNAVFVGAMRQLFPAAPRVGFLQWMFVGVPIVVVLIPLAWLYLVRVASNLARMRVEADPGIVMDQLEALGRMRTPEKRVLVVFVATALSWMFRRPLELGVVTIPGWSSLLPAPEMIGDSTVAMAMALVLFVSPAGDERGSRLLSWEAAVRLPWGVIVLLGGGFALAEAIHVSSLAQWIGGELSWVGSAPPWLSIVAIALATSMVTEVTTNTAITTIMMPVLAASAAAGTCDPLLLMVPCTLAASLCFMLPSGTAPNAIVFSGGGLTVPFMARTGFGLNLLAVVVVSLVTYLVAVPVFDVSLGESPSWATPSR